MNVETLIKSVFLSHWTLAGILSWGSGEPRSPLGVLCIRTALSVPSPTHPSSRSCAHNFPLTGSLSSSKEKCFFPTEWKLQFCIFSIIFVMDLEQPSSTVSCVFTLNPPCFPLFWAFPQNHVMEVCGPLWVFSGALESSFNSWISWLKFRTSYSWFSFNIGS